MMEREPVLNRRMDLPLLSCSLDGADQANRIGQWRSISEARSGCTTTPGRIEVRYRFGADELARLRELVDAERHCCGFATLALTTNGDEAVLEVTGPTGTEEFFSFLCD